jgi:two-component system, chemotaxis family, chemotaxis protein CheY
MPTGNILVVDDDPDIRGAICLLLDFAGYGVRAAANGHEALQAVEHTCPDLVVLDMEMPILDGWGFAHTLQERCIELKILVVTAGVDGQRWARDILADSYLGKPFGASELLAEVERLCAAGCVAAPTLTESKAS